MIRLKEEKPKKIISLSFRIDEELNEKIERMANKAQRSKSNFVIKIITDSLDDIERKESIFK